MDGIKVISPQRCLTQNNVLMKGFPGKSFYKRNRLTYQAVLRILVPMKPPVEKGQDVSVRRGMN